ncbi:MAG: hypothetical protein IJD90_01595 [Clostridia bacterium]|nr:hypothetical protein [Clostridia bacterium]
MKNKLVSLILIAIMVLTIIPSLAFASSDDPFAEDVFDAPVETTSTTTTTTLVTNPTSSQTTPSSTSKTDVDDPTNPDDNSQINPTPGSADSNSGSADTDNNPTVHTHIYIARMTKEPTCLLDGVKTYSCKCGDSYTEIVPKLKKHITFTKVVDSTYFKQGSKAKICDICGLNVSQKTLNKKVVSKSFFKLVKGKKQFKINYKRVGKSIGFQVRYRIKGKWKIKTFNTKKNVTKTIKKLKKGTYTVQIRAFRKLSGKMAYSRWTSSRKVKVTK